MKKWTWIAGLIIYHGLAAQNVGIGTANPQATLDVKGNQRIGGVNHFLSYDSATGNLSLNNRIAISDLSDGWLHLNQSGNYSNGIHTPGNLRADGSIFTSALYDQNNTGYYIDPASTTNINTVRFNVADCINGTCPPNNAIRMTPNFHFNAGTGYAVIVNWDNGTTGNTQTFRVGNGAGADAFYVNANGSVVAVGNIGINTASPNYPLSFPNTLGDKISLWGNSGAHYGFGIQSNLMQIHTDASTSDIAFGYGSSGAYTESMRIKGNGIMQFPASLQKKIILYPGSTGDAGFGVFGNELRISSDYSGADITFGYDNRASGFTEKFRMKANGALVLSGSVGNAGDVMQSNGAAGAVQWASIASALPSYYEYNNVFGSSYVDVTNSVSEFAMYNGTISINVPSNSRLIICANYVIYTFCPPIGSCTGRARCYFKMDGNSTEGQAVMIQGGGGYASGSLSNYFYDVGAGTHSIAFYTRGDAVTNEYWAYLANATVIVMKQ